LVNGPEKKNKIDFMGKSLETARSIIVIITAEHKAIIVALKDPPADLLSI